MKTSEKILVTLAVISVLAGGIFYLVDSSGKNEESAAVEITGDPTSLETDVAAAQAVVKTSEPGALASYIVAHSTVSYAADPFYYREEAPKLDAEEVEEAAQEEAGPSIILVYSGFMEIGGRRMAIINDQEYEVGDDVAQSGFLLKTIQKDLVELAGREGRYFLRIPFADEGF